ncbi:MAG: AAA family ATPase [Natronospirillum sp.]
MYLDHFNLDRHPFRIAPEDQFVYMSQQHSRAYVYMDSSVWSPESFVVISGEVGSGKTTLLKKLMRGLDANLKLIHVSYTNLNSNDLFHLIALQAGMEVKDTNKIALLFAIRDFLRLMSKRKVPVMLAVDEAQALSQENLEDIRMLAGLEGPYGPMLRVILLGQPELRQHINAVPQLTQRIKLYFHIGGLSESEVDDYIEHRLGVAGYRGAKLFPPAAVRKIYEASRGIPRLINKLCDGLMLCAYADERMQIDIKELEDVRQEVFAEELGLPELNSASETNGQPHKLSSQPMNGYNSSGQEAQSRKPGQQGMALDRIALALEGIESKLDVLIDRRHPHQILVNKLAKK